MIKFNLVDRSNVPGEGRQEEAYTYTSEDGTKSVQFRAHSTRAFVYMQLSSTNVNKKEFTKLVNAFVNAGFDQDKFDGGFYEAIKTLTI